MKVRGIGRLMPKRRDRRMNPVLVPNALPRYRPLLPSKPTPKAGWGN